MQIISHCTKPHLGEVRTSAVLSDVALFVDESAIITPPLSARFEPCSLFVYTRRYFIFSYDIGCLNFDSEYFGYRFVGCLDILRLCFCYNLILCKLYLVMNKNMNKKLNIESELGSNAFFVIIL